MASIRDVAIKAGVGIGTVSRALNGSGYISDETKQKIMQAVEELNYKPNELARTCSATSPVLSELLLRIFHIRLWHLW